MPATRSSNKTARLTPVDDHTEDEYDSNDAQDAPPPRKRAKTKTANQTTAKPVKRRKGGKLSKLPDMPLDVLFEIFGCLHPLDLLHISRTTKSLQTVVMSRSARSVWRDAFASVDVPDCPEDLSEPEFANLLFDNLCYSCVKSRATQTFWIWRRRYCKKCLNEQNIVKSEYDVDEDGEIWEEIRKQMKPLDKMLPYAFYKIGNGRNKTRQGYLISDIERFEAAVTCEITEGNDLKQLMNDYVDSLAKKKQHAYECASWQRDLLNEKDGARDGARERRQDAQVLFPYLREARHPDWVSHSIMQKLDDLGWREELRNYPSEYRGLLQQPGFKLAKDLTDRMWVKIEPSIVEFLERIKEARLAKDLDNRTTRRFEDMTKLLLRFARTMGPNDVIATAADICFVPGIREVVINGDEKAFQELKLALPARLPELSKNCINERDALLLELLVTAREAQDAAVVAEVAVTDSAAIPEAVITEFTDKSVGDASPSGSSELSNTNDVLRLATSWFKCSYRYCDPLDHDQVRNHGCLFVVRHNQDPATNAFVKQIGTQPWNLDLKDLKFHGTAAKVAAELVKASGKDPLVTTAEEMDLLNPRFALLQKDSISVVTWRKIIALKGGNGNSSDDTWRRLPDDELPEYTVFGALSTYSSPYNCLHCFKSGVETRGNSQGVDFDSLQRHFNHSHQDITMTKADYYLSQSDIARRWASGFTRAPTK